MPAPAHNSQLLPGYLHVRYLHRHKDHHLSSVVYLTSGCCALDRLHFFPPFRTFASVRHERYLSHSPAVCLPSPLSSCITTCRPAESVPRQALRARWYRCTLSCAGIRYLYGSAQTSTAVCGILLRRCGHSVVHCIRVSLPLKSTAIRCLGATSNAYTLQSPCVCVCC